jgi:hypothetical protein
MKPAIKICNLSCIKHIMLKDIVGQSWEYHYSNNLVNHDSLIFHHRYKQRIKKTIKRNIYHTFWKIKFMLILNCSPYNWVRLNSTIWLLLSWCSTIPFPLISLNILFTIATYLTTLAKDVDGSNWVIFLHTSLRTIVRSKSSTSSIQQAKQ